MVESKIKDERAMLIHKSKGIKQAFLDNFDGLNRAERQIEKLMESNVRPKLQLSDM